MKILNSRVHTAVATAQQLSCNSGTIRRSCGKPSSLFIGWHTNLCTSFFQAGNTAAHALDLGYRLVFRTLTAGMHIGSRHSLHLSPPFLLLAKNNVKTIFVTVMAWSKGAVFATPAAFSLVFVRSTQTFGDSLYWQSLRICTVRSGVGFISVFFITAL